MKKHITDLRNALYNHDLTVASEDDSPAFPAMWTWLMGLEPTTTGITIQGSTN